MVQDARPLHRTPRRGQSWQARSGFSTVLPGLRRVALGVLGGRYIRTPMDGGNTFRLEQENVDGRRRVAVAGEIDLQSAPALEEALQEACERGTTIELDLHEVSFIDSTS